jgi:SAM-dependent methyltransferase
MRAAAQNSPATDTVFQLACPVCERNGQVPFFKATGIPVRCNVLFTNAIDARHAGRGDLSLCLCSECGLVYNAAFDQRLVEYDESYENSLHYSARFATYADQLARDLSERLALRNRLVAEIGCGKGEFLRLLCRTAGARGLGIDGSYDAEVVSEADDGLVQFIREPFSAVPENVAPALVLCRHVIEHLPHPRPFLEQMTAAARRSPDCHVFLEVPNVLYTLCDLGIWDLIYEHCAYYSAPALHRLCEVAGLRVERLYSTYGDQFLCVDATVAPAASITRTGDIAALSCLAEDFALAYKRKVDFWQARLQELHSRGRRVVVWGAGSKGITFVNIVPGAEIVSCLVDLNPRKHGRFVPGTGQPVVAPQALTQVKPDLIIVMNPLYRSEIEQHMVQMAPGCELALA